MDSSHLTDNSIKKLAHIITHYSEAQKSDMSKNGGALPSNIHESCFYIFTPIAIAITNLLLPILLILYVRLISGGACWLDLGTRDFRNWGSLVWLALPGLVMVEAKWVAFEVSKLESRYSGTIHLAARGALIPVALPGRPSRNSRLRKQNYETQSLDRI